MLVKLWQNGADLREKQLCRLYGACLQHLGQRRQHLDQRERYYLEVTHIIFVLCGVVSQNHVVVHHVEPLHVQWEHHLCK